jgi:hypothetical protein
MANRSTSDIHHRPRAESLTSSPTTKTSEHPDGDPPTANQHLPTRFAQSLARRLVASFADAAAADQQAIGAPTQRRTRPGSFETWRRVRVS